MRISTDAHYIIGDEHDYCQDYAIAGSFNDKNFAVVCDGCSSANDSDLGARLLALAFKQSVFDLSFNSETFPLDQLRRNLMTSCLAAQAITHIHDQSFYATIVGAVQEDNNVWVWMQGDGVFAVKHRDGKVSIYSSNNHKFNAPAYLAYLWDKHDTDGYSRMGEETINSKIVLLDGARIENTIIDTFPSEAYRSTYLMKFDVNDIESVVLFSDGIDSFRTDMDDAFDKMTQFPNLNGSFIRRKMKAMKKQWNKDGLSHYDDIGVAAIVFTHEDQNG